MQFKPVPEPPDNLESVEPILAAVPVTAGAVDDCCHHLVSETRLETRSEAETWLTFLRALELVTEDPNGYRRTGDESPAGDVLESDQLREPFLERVYGADSVLESLERAEKPLPAADVFDLFRDEIPAFGREGHSDRLEAVWTERVQRLLDWAVLLDLAGRSPDGDRYRPAVSRDRSAE